MSSSRYRRYLRGLIKACKNKSCADCGIKHDQSEMSYDHVRGEKKFNLGGSLRGLTEEDVRLEMAKCEVVCIYCHRIREERRAST